VSHVSKQRPENGARFVVERAQEQPAAVMYRGFVHLPDRDLPLEVTIELPGGATTASLVEGGPVELEKAAAALVRSATKAAVSSGTSLPRKIVRWRA